MEVIPEDIEIPEPEQAVAVFRKLLSNVANRAELSPNQLRASNSIYAGDGGVDATIVDADQEKVAGTIIPTGTTGFQVKRSDLSGKQAYKNEVTNKAGELGDSIRRLLEDGGAYRLVVFESPSESMLANRKEGLREAFKEAGYPDANVDVIISEHLTQEINKYPALVTGLVSSFTTGEDIDTWSRSTDISSIDSYIEVSARMELIESIRTRVQSHDSESFIRVTGLPGIGKTRLVFEAVSHEEIEHRVLYTDAERFQGSDLEAWLKTDNSLGGVVVIDRCAPDDIERFRRSLGGQADRLSIITICDQFQSPPYDIHLEPLPDHAVHELLEKTTSLPAEERRSVVTFAMGFPQVAELVVESGSNSGFDIEDAIVKRLLGSDSIEAGHRKHRRVLEGFALFSLIKWKTADGERGPNIEWILEQTDFSDERGLFMEIVHHHQERGILQGSRVLSVRPFPLVLYLLESWMRQQSAADVRQAVTQMPSELAIQFRSRVQSATEFEPGRRWAEDVLSAGGPGVPTNERWAMLEIEVRSRLFLELDDQDRQDTVRALRRSIPQASEEDLEPLTRGHPPVLQTLKQIALWQDTFEPAAKALLDLAAAESTQDQPTTANQIFTSLFWWGYGEAAPTELAPVDRLPVLRDALDSNSAQKNIIGIQAASHGLPDQRTGRPRPVDGYLDDKDLQLWTPSSHEELLDYWDQVWSLMRAMCSNERYSVDVRQRAVDTLCQHATAMASQANAFSRRVRETLGKLFEYQWTDKPQIIRVARNMPDSMVEVLSDNEASAWKNLLNELSQSTYQRRLYWGVGLDHSISMEDEEQKEFLTDLAKEGIETGEIDNEKVLHWLVSNQVNGWWAHKFGVRLGRADEQYVLVDRIESLLRSDDLLDSIRFPAGYLYAIGERDRNRRQAILDDLHNDGGLEDHFGVVSRLSGADKQDLQRILSGLREESLSAPSVMGFWVSGAKTDIPASLIDELCEELLDQPEVEGGYSALELFAMYYARSDKSPPMPEHLAAKILTYRAFTDSVSRPDGVESHWRQLATVLAENKSKYVRSVMRTVLENIHEYGALAGGSHTGEEFISDAVGAQPELGWDEITTALEKQDQSSRALLVWLQSDRPRTTRTPMVHIQPHQLWDWIDCDPDSNLHTAALIIPTALPHPTVDVTEPGGLVHEFLVRYGDQKDAGAGLHTNYNTRGLRGSTNEVYDERMDQLNSLREEATDDNVIQWIDERKQALTSEMKQEELREE